MKRTGIHMIEGWSIGVVLVLCGLLFACTEESRDSGEKDLLRLTSYIRPFEEELQETRNGALVNDYLPFESVYPISNSSISFGIFMAADASPSMELITYQGNGQWQSFVGVQQKQYYLYGFLPAEAVSSASVEYLDAETKRWEDGAIMRINGLSSVTAEDICVVIGVQNATSAETPEYLRPGYLGYLGRPKGQNYVGLLLSHIYSAVDFQFQVDAAYHALRHIKLKKLVLKTQSMKSIDAIVEIRANTTGESPVRSITWSSGTVGEAEAVLFESAEGEELTTTAKLINGFMTPSVSGYLVLESEYDVYDTHNNLVRQGCKAVNNLSSVVSPVLQAGQKSVVTLTIKPTYLYVLSDPDLDNPTMNIGD